MTTAPPEVDLPRMPRRRRLLLLLLAVATALTIFFLMIYRPGDSKRGLPRAVTDKLPRCEAGQSRDCVGGTADVMLVPAAPAAPSTPSSASLSPR
jgi:hypothetical protein